MDTCWNCSHPLSIHRHIWRFLDVSLCSEHCRDKRKHLILQLDPNLLHPNLWSLSQYEISKNPNISSQTKTDTKKKNKKMDIENYIKVRTTSLMEYCIPF